MRLIDADALKKEFNNSSYGLAAKSIIEDAPTVDAAPVGWISVETDLPKTGEYQVQCDNGKIRTAEYDSKYQYFMVFGLGLTHVGYEPTDSFKVTHWMSSPPGAKMEREGKR